MVGASVKEILSDRIGLSQAVGILTEISAPHGQHKLVDGECDTFAVDGEVGELASCQKL